MTAARTFRETALASQATLLGKKLLGAAANLGQVSAQGVSSDEAHRLLVSAEASLAQVEIVALGYAQISGKHVPLSEPMGFYTAQIRLVRQELDSGIPLTEENRKTLADVKSDLELLHEVCQADTLVHGNQQQITALFETAAEGLRVEAAKSYLQGSTHK